MSEVAQKRWIERVAISIALLCILSLIGTGALYALRVRLGASGEPRGYGVGQKVDLPASLYETSNLSVLLFVRGSCPACERAMPIFREVLLRSQGQAGIHVRWITPHGSATNEQSVFIKNLGLPPGVFHQVSAGGARVRVAPTIIAVDRVGRIQFAHEGELPSAEPLTELFNLLRR